MKELSEELSENQRRIIDQIKSDMMKALSGFIDKPLNENEIISGFTDFLKNQYPKESKHIKFILHKNCKDVIPGNLFTALILAADYQPYWTIEGVSFVKTEKGRYEFNKSDGSLNFQPLTPIKRIDLNFTITNGGAEFNDDKNNIS